tara:strand:- start:1927 stop:2142 length:216 start_codon:yes stop_codon:yes gene_type:complete
MATEEFKQLTVELFDNYLSLHKNMAAKAGKDINLSFKEYIEFYLRYVEEGTSTLSDYDDEEDYDLSEEDEE